MPSSSTSRIAKNTLLLYFRMLLTMGVTLYTSRVILNVLGVEDYGIYNVVGGVVAMLGFLQGTMATASARFMNVSLSKNDYLEVQKTFSNIFFINVFLAVIVFILAETFGLWFLNVKMTIPIHRDDASFWVYQFSVVTVILNIITVPFNATIIAHEKMSAFAYISIFDAVAKLIVVYLIVITHFDRLIFYSFLIMLVQIIDIMIYIIYCIKVFPESKIQFILDKVIFKKIFSFITWSSYGSFATAGFTQGLNIILNLFFGPTVNAARGIAVQVQHAMLGFTNNFQTAINPQLMKSTAQQNFSEAQKLFVASSKYSFFLLCALGLPIIIETPFVLSIWLENVPDYTVSFCRIILVISIWGSLANPLRIVNQAEGNIKKFQLYECTLLLLIMPISYMALKMWQIPILVFVVHLLIELTAQFVRITIVVPKIKMTFKEYVSKVYLKAIPAFFIPVSIAIFVAAICKFNNNVIQFIFISILIESILLIVIFCFGLTLSEKKFVKSRIMEVVKKRF